ncbi:uncharacterized protein TM35_000191220 [Trypanosoma theileri]|uniref:Uncharacterized protein n=1 Tax=Trypanosoma theileri TaxID=67003 RepID=A0A1X0NTL3_9TRYP|nr:uncharacterized protein TM35_000191220 [Trypanosoma theileri]ORC87878.1 hypothetical protein TM35_000191220 [Trypanosoma theileri]
MRRSVFFMGRNLTRRHLNACRSPLLTGYVRTTSLSCTAHGLTASPLSSGALLGSATASGSPLRMEDVTESIMNYTVATLLAQGMCAALITKFSCMQNISTCVIACERVFMSLPADGEKKSVC